MTESQEDASAETSPSPLAEQSTTDAADANAGSAPAAKPARRTAPRRATRTVTAPTEDETAPTATPDEAPRDVAALVARASGRAEPVARTSPAESAATLADAPPATQRPRRGLGRRELWLLTAALVVVGALAGYVFAGITSQYIASARVNAGPGSTTSQQLAVSGDQANRYVQTEVLFLLDPAVGERVQAQLSLEASPNYVVRQVGNTSVLEVSATDDSSAAAADIANAVVADYVAGWRDRTDSQLAGQIQTTTSQLNAAQAQMTQFSGATLTPNEQAQLTASTTLAQQLQTQLNDLNAQRAAVQSDERIVTEASAGAAGKTSSRSLMTVLGALLGGLAAVGVWYWARRSRS